MNKGFKFRQQFVEKVKQDKNHWRDPEFILSHEDKVISINKVQIKINGFLYDLSDLEIV